MGEILLPKGGRVEFGGETDGVSDGYHTFKELYDYRMLYNAGMFSLLSVVANSTDQAHLFKLHKSTRHSDGELCFGGGWFIVMVTLPTGQVSNHYELKDWDLFKIPERERAEEWDGHTPQVAAERLRSWLLRGNS